MDRLIGEKSLLDKIDEWKGFDTVTIRLSTLRNIVKAIPSAEPKTGHWIDRWWEEGCEGDCVRWRCSECKELSCCNSNFCGDCGAKMVEPQERSDKE